MSNSPRKVLTDFQKLLLERKIVTEKQVPFFAYYVSRIFKFAHKRYVTATVYQQKTVMEFLENL